ncbi:MAG: UvrD-helicase domain-containing protein, partial [Clostridia bacterium]|nr:UvrD-helicase domain-containing protein [Clostridia bacterium]
GECAIRSRRVMEQLICDCYDREDADGSFCFSMLTESITTTRGEGSLADIFLSLYKTLCSYPGGAENLRRVATDYDRVIACEFFDTVYGKIYREYTERIVSSLVEKYKKIMSELCCEDAQHPYLAAMSSDLAQLDRILVSLPSGYVTCRESVLSFSFEKLRSVARGKGTVTSSYAQLLRSEAKGRIAELGTMYAYDRSELDDAASKTATLSRTLSEVLCEYESRYREDKRDAGIVDFNDLEYYAARLLYDGEERSDAAREIEALTDEIYIDEYQDVNELQDSIFRAVSNGKNLFMVGDVKQSIYTFRGGDPSIITSLRDSCVTYDRNSADTGASCVFMQNNFRCDSAVVDYVNGVFATLLGKSGGKFEYKREDELVYTKDGGVVSEREVFPRFVLCEADSENTDPSFDAEAVFVGEEIVRLLSCEKKNGERIRPSDIAILLRSDANHAAKYKRELEKRGVPVVTPSKDSPFDTPELQLVLCMLNAIDNPHRDVYLAGVLMSEIYSVSAEELVRVKCEYPRAVSLYDAVCRYTKEHGWEAGRRFISENDKYRALARKTPVDRLIWQIYLDTPLLRCAVERYPNSYMRKEAKKNCMYLYECAHSFEQGAFKGLYNFIEYLGGIIERGAFEGSSSESGADAVRIMSMHASKGLEFPVCFVSGTASAFNTSDSRSRLLFEPGVGIGFKLRGEDGFSVCETPFRTAVNIVKSGASMEEELRILYVALTRARERLYVTAEPYANSTAEKLLEKADYKSETFSSDTVLSVSSFAEGIMIAHKREALSVPLELVTLSDKDSVSMLTLDTSECEQGSEQLLRESTISELKRRLSFEYPNSALTKLRAKMSVSRLYPGVLDEEGEDEREIEIEQL